MKSTPINSIRDIAALVRGRRRELELSQADLADRMGVSRQWVAGFEAGKPGAELRLVIRLVDALGLCLSIGEAAGQNRGGDARAGDEIDLDSLLDRHRAR